MRSRDVFDLLAASGPFAGYAERVMLYGRFVGSWDVEATWYEGGEARRRGEGEWHFAWVLGGRGVQDVLYGAGAPPDRFGTTLRCYDPEKDTWHIAWMQPASGEFVYLQGRPVGDDIVQEVLFPVAGGQCERWRFTEIAPDSFRWLGEVSKDGGATWELVQEMRARRA